MVVQNETPTPPKRSPHRIVLIATDNIHESQHIGETLEQQGFNVQFCQFDGIKLKGTPISAPDAVLFVFSDYIEKTPNIVSALKTHFAPRDIPFIGALMRQGNIDPSIFDSVIFPPAHITQIANRVSSMIRLGQMEREIVRRVDTLREDFEIEYELSDEMLRSSFRILFIGKASPDFMVIINALQKKNVEVVAAFTSFSAFDFLHEHKFDAVVMNALEQTEPAFTISETMRRNPTLYHVPTLFLVDPENFRDHDLAYQKGARDIISSGAPTEEISGRILELANYHRLHTQLKTEFGSIGGENCIDFETGVFNAEFFSAHLHRVCKSLQKTEEFISLMAIRVRPNAHFQVPDAKVNEAFAQIGKMLKNLVRMQDITARLDTDVFMIAFPGQSTASLSPVLERISGIVECAAFESGDIENGAFTVSLEMAIIDQMGHENSESLIASAWTELTGDPVPSNKKSA
jgi:two-component system cell cycle response regulator PopA